MLPFLHITPFPAFTNWTPVIPKMYWGVYSTEQRLKAICERLCKSEAYMDYVARTINDYAENVSEEVQAELDAAHRELVALREELIALILETGEGSLDWDVTKGRYDSSVNAMRSLFYDVTVHAIDCEQLSDIPDFTVSDLADSGLNVRGLAVMSRWLIDHDQPIYPEFQTF